MFTAALFAIANTWKQPKCPSMDKWIRKLYIYIYIYMNMMYIYGLYIMEYYSGIK